MSKSSQASLADVIGCISAALLNNWFCAVLVVDVLLKSDAVSSLNALPNSGC